MWARWAPPAAAAAPWCLSHTVAANLSSGSHVSGVGAVSRPFVSFLPAKQTGPWRQKHNRQMWAWFVVFTQGIGTAKYDAFFFSMPLVIVSISNKLTVTTKQHKHVAYYYSECQRINYLHKLKFKISSKIVHWAFIHKTKLKVQLENDGVSMDCEMVSWKVSGLRSKQAGIIKGTVFVLVSAQVWV